jgi:hypothetical protein
MNYNVIESIVLLILVSGSLIYLTNLWFPRHKYILIQLFIKLFPRANGFLGLTQKAVDYQEAESANGCSGCAPTGACGQCPTKSNR